MTHPNVQEEITLESVISIWLVDNWTLTMALEEYVFATSGGREGDGSIHSLSLITFQLF